MLKVSYNKLFSYLYKNNISSKKLSEKTGVSRNSIIKMKKGEAVHLSIILAICEAYNLEFKDIIEVSKE